MMCVWHAYVKTWAPISINLAFKNILFTYIYIYIYIYVEFSIFTMYLLLSNEFKGEIMQTLDYK